MMQQSLTSGFTVTSPPNSGEPPTFFANSGDHETEEFSEVASEPPKKPVANPQWARLRPYTHYKYIYIYICIYIYSTVPKNLQNLQKSSLDEKYDPRLAALEVPPGPSIPHSWKS
jgi:hypothetical protein